MLFRSTITCETDIALTTIITRETDIDLETDIAFATDTAITLAATIASIFIVIVLSIDSVSQQ